MQRDGYLSLIIKQKIDTILFSLVFEWGTSTEINKFGSFNGQDYVDMQFGVVKK